MPLACAPDKETTPYAKSAGYSPLPGYVLLEPLGRGGFGEVWKCEAPGGLHKAIKFVTGDADATAGTSAQLRQEYDAFQQIKMIRHPFLLSLERVELGDNELVMVMELADHHLGDRFAECRAAGLSGVPRDELIGYMREAAEALDVIGTKYGLQHLDVKPANLFLTAGHLQVGDYGLVSKLDSGKGDGNRGLTPRYAAPEVLRGQVHTRSDQYSLALVYYELVCGGFPFNGRTAQQLMMQHASAAPDLSGVSAEDRSAVATALAKDPKARFASCAEFVRALTRVTAASVPTGTRLVPAGGSGALTRPAESGKVDLSGSPAATHGGDETDRNPPPVHTPAPRPVPRAAATPRIAQVLSVIPAAWLQGKSAPHSGRPAANVVNTVVRAAEAEGDGKASLGAILRQPDGAWRCSFLTTIDPRVAAVKLDLLWEEGGVTMDSRAEGQVVFRKLMTVAPPSGLFGAFSKKPKAPDAGLEVVVDLPDPGQGTAEVSVAGRLFGAPAPEFVRSGEKLILKLIDGIRRTLSDVSDRRKHPRFPVSFLLAVYPLQSDGRVEKPITALCRDVSAGGLSFFCATKPTTKYAYVTFEDVPGAAGQALLLQMLSAEWQHDEVLVTGQFRLDLGPHA